MRRWVAVFAAAYTVSAASALWAATDETTDAAARMFDDLFGEQVEQVATSPGVQDDLALAARLVEAAKTAGNQPAFISPACEHAYLLASKAPAGYAKAIEAMELLAEKVPEKRETCREKIVEIRHRQYAGSKGADRNRLGQMLIVDFLAATESRIAAHDFDAAHTLCQRALKIATAIRSAEKGHIQATLQRITAGQRTIRKAKSLKTHLQANRDDEAARRELVRLYIVELDDPKEAAKHLNPDADDLVSKYVLVAAMSVDRLPERACRELGDWYRGLAEKADPYGKVNAWNRALKYYEAYLKKHGEEDALRVKVTVAKKDVEEALRKAAVDQDDVSAAAPGPKLIVITEREFAAKYARRFPAKNNLGSKGKATASPAMSSYYSANPNNVFTGSRTGSSWMLYGRTGHFEAKWDPPVTARYVLMFGRFAGSGRPYLLARCSTYVSVNGGAPMRLRVMGLPGPRAAIVDTGGIFEISSVRLEFNNWSNPSLAGIEIHY